MAARRSANLPRCRLTAPRFPRAISTLWRLISARSPIRPIAHKECSMRIRSSSLLAVLLTAFAVACGGAGFVAGRDHGPGHPRSSAEPSGGVAGDHRRRSPTTIFRIISISAANWTSPNATRSAAISAPFNSTEFQGQIVLKITGNYFAAYSAERMTGRGARPPDLSRRHAADFAGGRARARARPKFRTRSRWKSPTTSSEKYWASRRNRRRMWC